MFSQFRQAVEGFAQPQPRRSQDHHASSDGLEERRFATDSSDATESARQSQSTNQLAEAALSNLRRSFAAQRPASSRSRSSSPAPSISKSNSIVEPGLRKSTLEERLRASFAGGEASSTTTPAISSRASTVTNAVPVTQHPLSPTSIPLPSSPSPSTTASISDIRGSDTPEDPPAFSLASNYPEHSNDEVSQIPSLSEAPQVPNDIPLPPSPQGELPLDGANDLVIPVSASTETGIITQLPDHPPVDRDMVVILGAREYSADIGGEANTSNPVDVVASEGHARTDTEGPPSVSSPKCSDVYVEALQERLRLIEQRFSDVSTSFKRLQAERLAADDVIRELTPLENTKDPSALREYLSNLNMKFELAQDELHRLNGKLTRQEERIEELRDTHRLETRSQLDQIDQLRQQLNESEALVSASQASASQTEGEITRQVSEIERLTAEVAKAKEAAREEGEKRVQAGNFLRVVRQKLAKAEKDRDDALKELGDCKEKEGQDREKERTERVRLQVEIDAVSAEREKAVTGLRAQFDKEIATMKDRVEKELSAAHAQSEAENAALKTLHSTELTQKRSQIAALETSLNNLSRENRSFFEQLQIRQAELESSQHHVGTLQGQNTELQFQLREVQDRVTLLTEEISDLRGEHDLRAQGSGVPQEDISQLISTMEAKYEAKLAEIKRNLAVVEKERTESEADWSRKLCEKGRETDELRTILQSSAKLREEKESTTGLLKGEIEKLAAEVQNHRLYAGELQLQVDRMKDAETSFQLCISDAKAEAESYRSQLEDMKAHEAQLRGYIKTLREELRKVQTSAALLERQRNPGVGYWTSRSENTDSRASVSSASDLPSRTASPGLASPPPSKGDEEINLEYLRNVILQFLEHKEMRPSLVRVLSIILRFTPQETRRLIAKV